MDNQPSSRPPASLTPREQTIVILIAGGLSNAGIARQLGLSPNTVAWHNKQIFNKLGVKRRTQAVVVARALGLLDTKQNPGEPAKRNLPYQITPFVGRKTELNDLTRLLAAPSTRLVTILGPGGMGKTRLALEIAARHETKFEDGVHFIPIHSLSDASHISSSIAEKIDIQLEADIDEADEEVINHLIDKRMLLVMDNFEHLLTGAELANTIIQSAPGIKILATSRERLNLRGETVYHLHGMQFPSKAITGSALEYDALNLLAQSATRSSINFNVTENDLPAMLRICELVDGMPLAIELAAGWVDIMPLEKIADALENSIDLLKTRMRDVPVRHRSIRATFEYTWERLNPEEQRAFRWLTVFNGGFTTEAAEAVTGSDAHMLRKLADKALLRQISRTRYDLHDLLRQYAREQLKHAGEAEAARIAHMTYFAAKLRQYGDDLKGGRQLAALEAIEADFANIWAAWHTALESSAYDVIEPALEGLMLYCEIRGRYAEVEDLLRHTHDHLAPIGNPRPHPLWGRMIACAVYLGPNAVASGELHPLKHGPHVFVENPEATINQVLANAESDELQSDIAHCLATLAHFAWQERDFEKMNANLLRALAIFRELDDPFYAARMLNWLSVSFMGLGKPDEAIDTAQDALETLRAIDDKYGTANCLDWIGNLVYLNGQAEKSVSYRHEALEIAQKIDSLRRFAFFTIVLGWVRFDQGAIDEVRLLTNESMAIARNRGYRRIKAMVDVLSSLILSIEEDYSTSQELLDAISMDYTDEYLTSELLHARSLACCGLGNYGRARALNDTALSIALQIFALTFLTRSLVIRAIVLASEGLEVRAVELLGLAYTHPASITGWMDKWPLLTRLQANLKSALGKKAYQAAWKRGTKLDLDAVAQAQLHDTDNLK